MEQGRSPRAMRRRWKVLLSAALLLSGAFARADDFSQDRLKDGESAYRERRYGPAVDSLRVAAFGLLDHPELLSEALVYLSLAQTAAGRREDARVTLSRFTEVERRFHSYSQAQLDPGLRREFEAAFRRELASLRLAPPPSPPAQAAAATPPARARPAESAGAERRASTDGEAQSAPQEEEIPPRVKRSVKPQYPRAAQQAGVGGTVLLRVLVSERGEPLQVEILRGIRPDLSEAAVEALKKWTFDPAQRNGRPVQAWYSIAIPFER